MLFNKVFLAAAISGAVDVAVAQGGSATLDQQAIQTGSQQDGQAEGTQGIKPGQAAAST